MKEIRLFKDLITEKEFSDQRLVAVIYKQLKTVSTRNQVNEFSFKKI